MRVRGWPVPGLTRELAPTIRFRIHDAGCRMKEVDSRSVPGMTEKKRQRQKIKSSLTLLFLRRELKAFPPLEKGD
jgi:hypothetical protein